MDATPLAYDTVVDRIRTGIRRAKGGVLADVDITTATSFWPTADPEQPSLSFDSLDFLELVVSLENEYGWTIPDTQIDVECLTVGDLAELVVENAPASP